MSVKPILFNSDMVKAILRGEKTQTRRPIKPQPVITGMTGWPKPILNIPHKGPLFPGNDNPKSIDVRWRFSPYKPGDILWVKETWAHPSKSEIQMGADPNLFLYKADEPAIGCAYDKWHPSIHMPREAARIFLHVTDVRVERVHDITEEDARAEGFSKTRTLFLPAGKRYTPAKINGCGRMCLSVASYRQVN